MTIGPLKLTDTVTSFGRREVLVHMTGMIEGDIATPTIGPLIPIGMRCCEAAETIGVASLALGVRNSGQIVVGAAMFAMTCVALNVFLIDSWRG